jgi:hypothetical protein
VADRRWLLGALAPLAGVCGACATTPREVPATSIPRMLLVHARPIGAGARFHPPATGAVIGTCTPTLGARDAVHVEVFAANRVVIVAPGIGARDPSGILASRVPHARCYGALVTLEPTGVVLVRPPARLTLSQLFRAWGQALTPSRLGSFRAPAGTHVSVFVDGKRWHGAPGSVPLLTHAEIVLEVGPYVPPHTSYTFSTGV